MTENQAPCTYCGKIHKMAVTAWPADHGGCPYDAGYWRPIIQRLLNLPRADAEIIARDPEFYLELEKDPLEKS